MFVTVPHLATRAPSPTTVQYTVSNAPRRRSVAARALFGLAILLRAAAVGFALLFLAVRWKCGNGNPAVVAGHADGRTEGSKVLGGCGDNLLGYYGTMLFDRFALRQPWELVIPLCVGVVWLCARRWHTEESLLVIRTLGLQTATTSRSYLGTATTRFIPTSQIQDIFIHEAFIGFEVRYYLAIVVQGEDEVTVVFPNLLPKLAIVEEVWRGARACLFELGNKVGEARGGLEVLRILSFSIAKPHINFHSLQLQIAIPRDINVIGTTFRSSLSVQRGAHDISSLLSLARPEAAWSRPLAAAEERPKATSGLGDFEHERARTSNVAEMFFLENMGENNGITQGLGGEGHKLQREEDGVLSSRENEVSETSSSVERRVEKGMYTRMHARMDTNT